MTTQNTEQLDQQILTLVNDELNSSDSPHPAPEASAINALSAAPGSLIDHTLLAPGAMPNDITRIVEEAVQYKCATICVNSSYIPLVRDQLQTLGAAETVPIAVVGFPLGAAATEAKVFEAKWAIQNGAKEIDMVQHVGKLKARDYSYVYEDIRAVVEACGTTPVKVILETCLLSESEIVTASVLAREANASFIKTSTGFSTGGATVEAVRLMRRVAVSQTPGSRRTAPRLKVKASGGVGTFADLKAMVEAGAERVGASRTATILGHAMQGAAGGY